MGSECVTLIIWYFFQNIQVLYICTLEATLEEEKSNFSSLSEAITGKFCTEFKGKTPVNVCMEVQQNFSSISEIQMSSSVSTIWEDEISEISWTSRASGEGVTAWRLSSIRIDWVEDSTSSKRVEADTFD